MTKRSDSQNKKSVLTLVSSMIAMIMTIAINFFLSPYIVKTLGEEANGLTQLASNFVNYAALIALALNSMAGRFITLSYYRGDHEKCEVYYSSVAVGNLLIICCLIVPAVILLFRLENVINIQTVNPLHVKLLFAFVFCNFFVAQANSIFSITAYVTNKQYLVNIINTIKIIFYAISLLIVFSAFTPQIYYVSLTACLLSCFTIPIFYFISRRVLPDIKIKLNRFSFKAILELLSSGIWNVISQCGTLLMTGMDLLLSNLFLGPIEMGVLAVSKTMPQSIAQVANNVNNSFSANLTIAYAEDDQIKVVRSLRYAMTCSSIMISIPVMILCVYGKSFYSLWQPTLDAITLTRLSFWACFQLIPFAGPQVLSNVYTTTNKLSLNSITVLAGGLLNIILVILLIKNTDYGLTAIAAVSSCVSIIRNLIITVPYTAKILHLKWFTFYKDVLISILCCLIAGAVNVLFQTLINPSSWPKMILSVFCACVFSLICLINILLSKQEKRKLISKLVRRKNG